MHFNKKTLKKILIILTMIMFAITLYEVIKTYALFQTEKDATIEIPIAKWNITLNGTDITNGSEQQIIIEDFSVVESPKVKPGRIAPGMSGMVDLTLNFLDTDVSVRYDINLNQIEDLPLEFGTAQILSGPGRLYRTDTDTYTGVVDLSNIKNGNNQVVLRIGIVWTNDEANNEIDTQIGTSGTHTVDVPLDLSVSQYLGEEIEEIVIK